MMNFHSTHDFSKKKADNNTNFTAGRIIKSQDTSSLSLYKQEQTLGDQLCDG
jgi:hypothetical protein